MEQLYVVAPFLLPLGYMAVMGVVYWTKCALGSTPKVDGLERRRFTDLFGPHATRYFLWLIQPMENMVRAANISPNAITVTSLALCAGSGAAVATGYLALATWAYVLAGVLDILDGRLARSTGRHSPAGAFLDSVADRWGELFVFAGFAWHLRAEPWLAAVMLALAGSMMVSYTRARGEGLGVNLQGGTMQRAERIAIVALGTLIAAWFDTAGDPDGYGMWAMGIALLITGLGSTVTSIGRWTEGYRMLAMRDRESRREEQLAPATIELDPVAVHARKANRTTDLLPKADAGHAA